MLFYEKCAAFSLCMQSNLFLAEFCKDAASALGMQEGNLQTISTATGSFVNKADAVCLALCQSLGYTILYLEGYMVNASATIVQEFLDSAFWACGFQQLDFYFTDFEKCGLYLLVLYNLFLVELQSKNVSVVGENFSNVLDGYAQMFDS